MTDNEVAEALFEVAKEDGAVLTPSVVKDFRLSIGLRRGGLVRIVDGKQDDRCATFPISHPNCKALPLFDVCDPPPPKTASPATLAPESRVPGCCDTSNRATLAPECPIPGCCDKSPGPGIPPQPSFRVVSIRAKPRRCLW